MATVHQLQSIGFANWLAIKLAIEFPVSKIFLYNIQFPMSMVTAIVSPIAGQSQNISCNNA